MLAIDLEIAQGLAHLTKFSVVIYLNYCGVKWFVVVAADLRLAVDVVAGFLFDDLCQMG